MFNVRVEYESTPIRHIAVQCPNCKKWFRGWEITEDDLRYDYEIDFAVFNCPVCETEFGGLQHTDKPNIEEVGHPAVYDGCLQKKEVWQ